MKMSVKPRYLLIATAVATGLYFARVSLRTLPLLAFLAYMASMHITRAASLWPLILLAEDPASDDDSR